MILKNKIENSNKKTKLLPNEFDTDNNDVLYRNSLFNVDNGLENKYTRKLSKMEKGMRPMGLYMKTKNTYKNRKRCKSC